MGTAATNVMEWASKRYARKGSSLTLNQATSKWVVNKKRIVEGFFLRSGRNFSADWLSRADLDQITEWAHRMGFYRARVRARWNEFIADWKQNQVDNWMPPQSLWGGKSLDSRECARNGTAQEDG